ncbi:MAG: hypothetical protein K1X88_33180 [Nannocystaceae bacterium]|nr:hypothetical protein [Nannocystaceae bacterium]
MLEPTLSVALALGVVLAAPAAPPAPASPPAPATAVANPDLAAVAPVPPWSAEGGEKAHATAVDPHQLNKQIRRAAATALSGGVLMVLGIGATAAGYSMIVIPGSRLNKLKSEHDGVLPPGDPARQHAIRTARAMPFVLGAGIGTIVVGAVLSGIGGRRFKKLREEKRTSVALGGMPMRGGGVLSMEVRF